MTETEWQECGNPHQMMKFVRARVSERKLRLFAIACCRQGWSLLISDISKKAIEVMERAIDGMASQNDVAVVRRSFPRLSNERSSVEFAESAAAHLVTGVAYYAAGKCASLSARAIGLANGDDHSIAMDSYMDPGPKEGDQVIRQASTLREILGNPICPVTTDPHWLTSTVLDLASTIYQDRSFEKLPILADALLDAGCDNEEMIDHCRGAGPHVRGCWVIDLLLGKE